MNSKYVGLGQAMWQELAPAFVEVGDANAADGVRERAQMWAGFMAGAVGSMAADLGIDIAATVVASVMSAAADVAKQEAAH